MTGDHRTVKASPAGESDPDDNQGVPQTSPETTARTIADSVAEILTVRIATGEIPAVASWSELRAVADTGELLLEARGRLGLWEPSPAHDLAAFARDQEAVRLAAEWLASGRPGHADRTEVVALVWAHGSPYPAAPTSERYPPSTWQKGATRGCGPVPGTPSTMTGRP